MGLGCVATGLVLLSFNIKEVVLQNATTLATCPDPLGIPNAVFVTTGPYEEGDLVTYNCNDGFIMSGVPSLVCQNDSTWSGTEPTCTLIDQTDTISHVVNYSDIPYTLPQWVVILICVAVAVFLLLIVTVIAAVLCSALKCCHRCNRDSVVEARPVTPPKRNTRVVPLRPVSEVQRYEKPRLVNVVHEVIDTQVRPAKEVKGWMPHSHPVRTINTSTK